MEYEYRPIKYLLEEKMEELIYKWEEKRIDVKQAWEEIHTEVERIFEILEKNAERIREIRETEIYLDNGYLVKIDPNQRWWSRISISKPIDDKTYKPIISVTIHTPFYYNYKPEQTYEELQQLRKLREKLEEILCD